MQARCWSAHTLQLDCWASTALLVPKRPTSISSVIAKILMMRCLSVLKRKASFRSDRRLHAVMVRGFGLFKLTLDLLARGLVECGAQSPRKLQASSLAQKCMKNSRRCSPAMAVQRGHLDAIGSQRLDHGIHFVIGENEIARDGSLAATGRLEVDCNGHAHRSDR